MSDALAEVLNQIASGKIEATRVIAAADSLALQGADADALGLYRTWLQYNSANPLAYAIQYNMGVLLGKFGDHDGAVTAFKAAIAQRADFYPAHINLGSTYERLGRTSDAVTQWLGMVNQLPAITGESVNYKVSALKQIGRVLEHTSLEESGEDALRQCIELVQPADAMQHWIAIRQKQCKWPVLSGITGPTRRQLFAAMSPHCLVFHTDDPLLHLARGYKYYKAKIGRPKVFFDRDSHRAALATRPKRRIRIGYLSSYFREHAHGYLTAEMYKLHDRSRFEVFAYSCSRRTGDRIQTQVMKDVDHWVDILEMSDEDVAKRIAADGIDILIDFNGYTGEARPAIMAMRPAPIAVNWLGYPGSMGTPYHDYVIADDFTIPPDFEMYYSEKVVRLPCYQPNDRQRQVASINWTREAAGLPANATVFCGFNGVQKITAPMWERFMDILSRVPNGVLWLLDGGERINERLRQEAIRHGVTPDRIIFAPKLINAEHLSRYPLADLFLDTSPCGAHTTASDALWMGVPVLTVAGRGFASRVCGSLAVAAGLGDMVCTTFAEYVEKAVELGNDKRARQAIRDRLAANRATCDLFDTDKLVSHLDGLLAAMWEDFVADRVPRPNLANLDIYDEIGTDLDRDDLELIARADYQDLYRAQLREVDRHCPVAPDARLWPGEPAPPAQAAKAAAPAKGKAKKAK
ncbi:glycosyl transferase [Paramagnetospirillum magneticum]|uniref:Predicted O-linked N-acetylglucosamine transferase n=1 Tax=Paramagnetospirillum magneticum (strain ATCC 700264 / AMB-1) TaxID=342108 RepID=Q2W0M9_PARM1|nr:glycosyl transferase [Paramagnetospirillum magneticum]BAE52596.1 Predicted O-linked N-acetylglucosamine transferase [Paramagnetospirillum magneticum AMB-1]